MVLAKRIEQEGIQYFKIFGSTVVVYSAISENKHYRDAPNLAKIVVGGQLIHTTTTNPKHLAPFTHNLASGLQLGTVTGPVVERACGDHPRTQLVIRPLSLISCYHIQKLLP